MRVARVILAVLALALAGSTSVRAADPTDTIGGKLSVGAGGASLRNDGTIPVAVTMSVIGEFTVDPDAFQLLPGATQRMAVTGSPVGTVSAHMAALAAPGGGDAASVTLQATLKPYVAPVDPPYGLLALLTGTFLLLAAARRWRVWTYRLHVSRGDRNRP